jgi:predicted adenine nucleotide alpha hydrolase (AANH) superfamily ATPase
VILLVHICCSVDSHYFLQRLQKEFPDEKLVGFFYNPNIQPYSEYYLRLIDVQRSCQKLGIELIEGEYDYKGWLESVVGYESEPEKGKRCEICFDNRLDITADTARKLGKKSFTTTLLMSPLKSQKQLRDIGGALQDDDLEFVFRDYRGANGSTLQNRIAKEARLYRQNYCGCLFALSKQRESQERVADELFVDVHNRVLPESIEDRVQLYQSRIDAEERGDSYEIIKDNFLNYRLLRGHTKVGKETVPSYFLYYSSLERKRVNGKIDRTIDSVGHLNRDSVKFIDVSFINRVLHKEYGSLFELLQNPPTVEEDRIVREFIIRGSFPIGEAYGGGGAVDLSPIVVVDSIPDSELKVEVYIESKHYLDKRERLVVF